MKIVNNIQQPWMTYRLYGLFLDNIGSNPKNLKNIFKKFKTFLWYGLTLFFFTSNIVNDVFLHSWCILENWIDNLTINMYIRGL